MHESPKIENLQNQNGQIEITKTMQFNGVKNIITARIKAENKEISTVNRGYIKPDLNFTHMAVLAHMEAGGPLVVKEIYDFVQERFPYYLLEKSKKPINGWTNSVRHTMSTLTKKGIFLKREPDMVHKEGHCCKSGGPCEKPTHGGKTSFCYEINPKHYAKVTKAAIKDCLKHEKQIKKSMSNEIFFQKFLDSYDNANNVTENSTDKIRNEVYRESPLEAVPNSNPNMVPTSIPDVVPNSKLDMVPNPNMVPSSIPDIVPNSKQNMVPTSVPNLAEPSTDFDLDLVNAMGPFSGQYQGQNMVPSNIPVSSSNMAPNNGSVYQQSTNIAHSYLQNHGSNMVPIEGYGFQQSTVPNMVPSNGPMEASQAMDQFFEQSRKPNMLPTIAPNWASSMMPNGIKHEAISKNPILQQSKIPTMVPTNVPNGGANMGSNGIKYEMAAMEPIFDQIPPMSNVGSSGMVPNDTLNFGLNMWNSTEMVPGPAIEPVEPSMEQNMGPIAPTSGSNQGYGNFGFGINV